MIAVKILLYPIESLSIAVWLVVELVVHYCRLSVTKFRWQILEETIKQPALGLTHIYVHSFLF